MQALLEQDLVDLNRLGEWMDDQDFTSGTFENQRLLTGGTQNILLYFERAGRSFVLRRPPKYLRANSNKVMMREARILKALAGSDVPHPAYIAHCDDESVLGAMFFLMEPVDGFNPSEGLPELHANDKAVRRSMSECHIEAIAKLGMLDYSDLDLLDFGKPDGFLQRQAGRWNTELESFSKLDGYGDCDLPYQNEIFEWLSNNVPSQTEPGIIHGDCHLANTMFKHHTGGTIGDPLLDLGWVMATTEDRDGSAAVGESSDGFMNIAQMVNHYAKHSSRDLSSLQWYAVLACYKLGAILEGTYARACAGKADKKLGEFMHNTSISLFNRANRWSEQGTPSE